ATEKIALDDGQESPLRLNRIDIDERGTFENVDHFLRRIAMQRLSRILDFETMTMTASAGGTVTLNARVAIACWEPQPPPPYKRLPSSTSMDDIITPMYRQKLDRLRTGLAAISAIDARFQPNPVLDSVAALDTD